MIRAGDMPLFPLGPAAPGRIDGDGIWIEVGRAIEDAEVRIREVRGQPLRLDEVLRVHDTRAVGHERVSSRASVP